MSMSANAAAPARQVVCPQCGGPALFSTENPYRPFCGERCRSIDLGAWASEAFRVPESVLSDDNDATSARAPRDTVA